MNQSSLEELAKRFGIDLKEGQDNINYEHILKVSGEVMKQLPKVKPAV